MRPSSTGTATGWVVSDRVQRVSPRVPPKYLVAAGSFVAALLMYSAGQEVAGRILLLSIIPLLYFF